MYGSVYAAEENGVLRELSTHKFRGLGDFSMGGLGRVNLLVGSNNCGKTSVLEAVHLLLTAGDPRTLWSTLFRRGERSVERVMEIRHLFEGHDFSLGSSFGVSGTDGARSLVLSAEIVQETERAMGSSEAPLPELLLEDLDGAAAMRAGFGLDLRWGTGERLTLPLTTTGGLDFDRMARMIPRTSDDVRPVELITTSSLNANETISGLQEVVLTENEDFLIGALQSIEPRIERIAPLGSTRRYGEPGARGGVVVKLSGMKNRIPLGSMGDGMWRMLGIALSLVRAKGGALLIDEIDTGLHYTVMEQMWRLVYEAAKRFDVQVIAATHSRDCYQSLASIVQAETPERPEITIQRIERGNPRSIAFTDKEIQLAADIGAEVR